MSEIDQGLAHHQAGRFQQAEAVYRQILADEPNHPDALHLLGVLAHQGCRHDIAVELIRKAIDIDPSVPIYHNNLGEALRPLQRWDEAVTAYERALALNPDYAEAYNNLGLALHAQGQMAEAVTAYQRALALQPDFETYYHLGNAFAVQAKLSEAIGVYRQALKFKSDFAEAHCNLGVVLGRHGNFAEAVESFDHAISLKPQYAEAHYHRGRALRELHKPDEAVDAFRRVLALKPDMAEAHFNLGITHEALGNAEDAAAALLKALAVRPDYIDARRNLVSVFNAVEPASYQPNIENELLRCFDYQEIDHQHLARIAANQIGHKYELRQRLHSDRQSLIEDISRDPLLIALLVKTFNIDPHLELVLTEMRRLLFHELVDASEIPGQHKELVAALSLHCFRNEYVFAVTMDEEQAISQLTTRGEQMDNFAVSDELEQIMLLLAMYIPLHRLSCAPDLGAIRLDTWSATIRPVIVQALKEPLEERAIAEGIESLGEIDDPTSQAVRAQYEQNPYPPWVDVPGYRKVSLRTLLRRHFPAFVSPDFIDGPTRVLVAGCGTGKVPISIALARDNVQVVAQDLSRRSLAYGVRMAHKLHADNVRFIHGDILGSRRLEQTFDVIECTGVLHHMKDPIQGWQVLTDILRPDGLMRIALYSEIARTVIADARKRISESGLTPTTRGIRKFRADVLAGTCAAEFSSLAESEDFYTLSACRDLLFHVQEHRFTLLQVWRAFDQLKLEFIGFELPGPVTQRRYQEFFGDNAGMTDRPMWERFEQQYPKTFAGCYIFWCQKSKTSGKLQGVSSK